MKIPPLPQICRRRASLAGLLAFIAAIAVATAWFHEESRWASRWAVVMLGGFATAAAIVTLGSRSLTDASVRLAAGSAVLLASVAWSRIQSETAGWHYRSAFHWAAYWALATVALPMLAGPGLRRCWAAAGRERWVDRLRQVPAGFLLFLLAIVLSVAIDYVLSAVAPPAPPPLVVRGSTMSPVSPAPITPRR
jgi:hypothetical protein